MKNFNKTKVKKSGYKNFKKETGKKLLNKNIPVLEKKDVASPSLFVATKVEKLCEKNDHK